ncbi:Intrinsic membrane protein PufX [Loktanella atrilutea]|uniref:Intrinsic membrane protein PufX n=1 Tax=Loktanella atrilutea TaxID=366533 RepID=A0A1M4Y6B3_LOKAT|nr:RC-LH1 core complex protein PufX [Loktanella atrilutea]SHF01245.1 Intrinsic membrane protein PufX [Loktanella atrilutea]
MTEKTNILGVSDKARLTGDVTLLMLKGAGYAAIVVLALWLTISVIAFIGRALPEESRQQPDPTPQSSLVLPAGPVVPV